MVLVRLVRLVLSSQMGRDRYWAAMEKWDAGILWLCKAYGVLRSVTCTTLLFG